MSMSDAQDNAEISVILATYERAGFIRAAIRSILNQTLPLKEIVVVDDGSQDATAEVVAAFGDRVTYLHQKNAGKLAAIARGLDHVTGGFVWIMDDDDLATSDAMEALVEPLAADPGCVLSYGRMSRFEDGQENTDSDTDVPYPPPDNRPFLIALMEDCFITGHPCVLVRRDALEAMRPFRSDILASVDYYLHLGVATQGKAAFVDRLVLRQRQHRGSRGPSALRYGEADRNARWIAHDKLLIGPLLQNLSLGAYLYDGDDPRHDAPVTDPLERRRALFQKASIAARKKLWIAAMAAFREAAPLEREAPLSADEAEILSKALGCRYGIDEVHDDPAIVRELRETANERRDPSEMLVPLSRPLLHEVKIARRERDTNRARRAVVTWNRLMPISSTFAAVRSILTRNARRALSR